MFLKKLGLIGLIGGVGLATGACTDGYGYSGVSLGYGNGGYYDDGYGYYGGDYYGGYGDGYYGGYAPASYGWYNGFYYPGTGFYVYDRDRRRYRWNEGQRRYWEGRRGYTSHGDRRIGFRDWNRYRGNGPDGRPSLYNGPDRNHDGDRHDVDRGRFVDRGGDARRGFRQGFRAPDRQISRPSINRGGGQPARRGFRR